MSSNSMTPEGKGNNFSWRHTRMCTLRTHTHTPHYPLTTLYIYRTYTYTTHYTTHTHYSTAQTTLNYGHTTLHTYTLDTQTTQTLHYTHTTHQGVSERTLIKKVMIGMLIGSPRSCDHASVPSPTRCSVYRYFILESIDFHNKVSPA